MTKVFIKLKRILLLVVDIILLYFSLWLILIFRYGLSESKNNLKEHLIPFSILYIFWVFIFYLFGIYDLAVVRRRSLLYSAFLKGLFINTLLGAAFFYFIPYFGVTPKTNLFLTAFVFLVLFFIWRGIYNLLLNKALTPSENLLLIGKANQIKELTQKIKQNPHLEYKIISILNPKSYSIKNLKQKIKKNKVSTVVFSEDAIKMPALQQALYQCLPFVVFKSFSDFFEEVANKVPVEQIDRAWFLRSVKEGEKRVYQKTKRLIDIITASLLTIPTIFIFPFVALAIKIEDGGPVFYKQKRIGQNGKLFKVIKFRSMKQNAEKQQALWAMKDDPRATKVGKLLRKSSVDELPQLINVLKGEMSLVGPRPERPEFLKTLTEKVPFYQIRHLIQPGLTGWAQINYPYGSSVKDALEKLQYDLFYLKNRSLLFDIRIILKTIGLYLKSERGKLAH